MWAWWMVDAADAAGVVDGGGTHGHGGRGRHSGLVDALGCGRDQGPWDMERKDRVFCSHIGLKNTSIF